MPSTSTSITLLENLYGLRTFIPTSRAQSSTENRWPNGSTTSSPSTSDHSDTTRRQTSSTDVLGMTHTGDPPSSGRPAYSRIPRYGSTMSTLAGTRETFSSVTTTHCRNITVESSRSNSTGLSIRDHPR
ncbi:hypothetical protein ASG80_16295 [Agromyces sp. Soil535]|nr:hypothetical protein ASG80_16295 [Agromyces sp. Soil535]